MQHTHRDRVIAGGDDALLLLEHAPVVTLGRRGGTVDRARLAELATPVVSTDRGGLATWHGPGQLVGYPIVDLKRARVSVPAFIERLGALMVAVARDLGVSDVVYDPKRPGVYHGADKVGSIGLRIVRNVTCHGFALNIDNELAGFEAIVPCGCTGLGVATLASRSAEAPTLELARRAVERRVDAGALAW